MIYTVITAKSAQDAQEQIDCSSRSGGVELRLDYWDSLDFSALKTIRKNSAVPLIFTLRGIENGGQYAGGEAERLGALQKLAELFQNQRGLDFPDYLDIEHSVSGQFLADLKKQFPRLNILRSYHNFSATPENLESLLDEMLHPAVSVYKLATQANSVLDGMRMLTLLKKRSTFQPLVGLCLGELGQFTRVLSPVAGGAWMYASSENGKYSAHKSTPAELAASLNDSLRQDQKTPPALPSLGLLSISELRNIYRFDHLNKNTAIYGLIGDPIAHSVGHIFHNACFAESGLNAVYVKFKCAAEELPDFFDLAKQLNIRGLSVTMPLKSSVIPFVNAGDEVVTMLGVANTLQFKEGSIDATNTDASGAVAAIEKHTSLYNKNLLIIGAGGAAKAIAYAASQAGAKVTLINRSAQKALLFADEINCAVLLGDKLNDTQHDFHLVINTLPCYPETQNFINDIVTHCVSPTTLAMDCVYNPAETLFIQAAKKIGSPIIYGKELFEQQALRQLSTWRAGVESLVG
jgi:3-dehydroquinate dehydratase/shikimate dehydrogenase